MSMQPAIRASRPFKLPLLQNPKPPAAVPQAPAAQACEVPATSQPRPASRPFKLPLLSKPASTAHSPATANSTIPHPAPTQPPAHSNRSASTSQQPHAATTAAAGRPCSFPAPIKASTAVTSSSTGHGSNSSSKPAGQHPLQAGTARGQPGGASGASTSTSTPTTGSGAKRPAGNTTVLASKRRKVLAPAAATAAEAKAEDPSAKCSNTINSTGAVLKPQPPVQDTAQPQAPSLRHHSSSRRRSISAQHAMQPGLEQYQKAGAHAAAAAHADAASPAKAAVQSNSAAVVTAKGATAEETAQMQQDLTDTPMAAAAAEAEAAGAVEALHMSRQQRTYTPATVPAAATVDGGGSSSPLCDAAASKSAAAEQRGSMHLQATSAPEVAAAPLSATTTAEAVMEPGQSSAPAEVRHAVGETPGQNETAQTVAASAVLQPLAQVPAKAALPAPAAAAPAVLDKPVAPPEQSPGPYSGQPASTDAAADPSAGTAPLTEAGGTAAAAAVDESGLRGTGGTVPAATAAAAAESKQGKVDVPVGGPAAAAAGAGQVSAKHVVMERLPVPKVCQAGSAWGPPDQQGLPGLLDLTAKMPRLKAPAAGDIAIPQIQQQSSRGLAKALIRQMVPKRINLSSTAAIAAGGAQSGKIGQVMSEGAAAAGCSSMMHSSRLQGVLRSALLQDHVQSANMCSRFAAGGYTASTAVGTGKVHLQEPRVDSRALQSRLGSGAAHEQQQQQCDSRQDCPVMQEGCSNTHIAAASAVAGSEAAATAGMLSVGCTPAAAAAVADDGPASWGPNVHRPCAIAADFSDCQELLAVMAAVLE